MPKTSTKKDLNSNRKHNPVSNQSHATWHASRHAAAAAASAKAAEVKKKRPSFGNNNAGSGKPRKKKQKLSHQQATQARDSLDAEFRDLRAETTNAQLLGVDSTATTMTALPPQNTTIVSGGAGLDPSAQFSEQSVQELAGVLGAL